MVKKLRINSNQSGFTLIEVMIALAIFAVFVVSFISVQGGNVTSSTRMRSEIHLKAFALNKVNEILANPPELKESLTLKPETGKFEEDENITYEITWKKFTIPDYEKIKGVEEDDEEEQKNAVQKKIFENVKENMEKLIWQFEVMVKDSATEDKYILSTWVRNPKATVKLSIQ